MPHNQLTFTCPEGIREQIRAEQDRLHLTSEGEVVRHILVDYFEKQTRAAFKA